MSEPRPAAKPVPAATTDVDPGARELDARIATFARRRARAHARPGRSLWAQATWVGTVGWLIAVPIVVGAFLGHLLDRRLGSGITWAMAFMGLGVLVGGYALWRLGHDVRALDDHEHREGDGGDPP
jgi:ATP synthase protein I